MKYIAVIGFGVVGGGIAAVLEENKAAVSAAVGEEVELKYILDLRDFPDSPYGDRVVHTIDPIVNDPEVALVCETMGGSHPAFEYTMQLLSAGKSVVTSNKEVVANFGDKMLSCAAEHGVSYLFEASVGGGIPVIRSMLTSLAGDSISSIDGILNGTTNYILTRMRDEGSDYADVLADAQKLGYAEKDPSADVDGIDAQRKIIILTALATGKLIPSDKVYAETMRTISAEDMAGAKKCGGAVKLIGSARMEENATALFVAPRIVPDTCQLSHIDDVYNGIAVTTPLLGDVLYYGRGAGRFPTASAVVADVCAGLSGAAMKEKRPVFTMTCAGVWEFDTIPFHYYVRFADAVDEEGLAALADTVKKLDELEYVIGKLDRQGMEALWEKLGVRPVSVIRMLE
ncbi:MAG: homoserine dehydrogenase [Clostridia bacterium]|nr:homoserine dehydrogenase [Clostridia bacterium]